MHEIWRINLDSGEPATLLTSLDANVDRFTVNRASRSLAYDHYTARQQIMLLDLASGVIDRSLESSARDMQPVARPNHDSMSFRSNRTGKEAIWEVAYSSGRGPQKLFETEGIIAGHDWSPDGKEIVFSTRKPGERFVIAVRRQDIGRETMLAGNSNADALFPSFAGSSRYVLYTEQNDDGRRRSVQFDRLTGERREVLDQNAILARRGPSGSIFFTRSDARGIWLFRPEIIEPVLVSDALAPRDWGKWSISPDGTTLAYFIHDASRIFVETFELSTESRQRFEIRNYLMGGGPNLAFLNSKLIAMATDDDYTGDIEAVQLSPQADNFAHLGENPSN